MSVVESQAAAASALLSAPVLRSAMRDGPASKLANRTISSLVESGLAVVGHEVLATRRRLR